MTQLLIDQREKRSDLLDLIFRKAEEMKIGTEMTVLPVGDYAYPDLGIGVEHKEAKGEYPSCINNGGLATQLADMEQYPYPFLFVTGKWEYSYGKGQGMWTQPHMVGSILSIGCRTKVKVFHWDNDTQFVHALLTLPSHIEKGERAGLEIFERHTRTANRGNPSLAMYLNIPGVGQKKAEELATAYPKFSDYLRDFQTGTLSVKILPKTREFCTALFPSGHVTVPEPPAKKSRKKIK